MTVSDGFTSFLETQFGEKLNDKFRDKFSGNQDKAFNSCGEILKYY